MVSEKFIDQVIEMYEEDKELYESTLSELMEAQPALLAFMTQESSEVLTEIEKDMAWYIALIILRSSEEAGTELGELQEGPLSTNEESNWEIYQSSEKRNFREKVTPFFEEYNQEDLLAFVEDTLESDEDSPITTVGREVIFIMSKSIIDSIFNIKN